MKFTCLVCNYIGLEEPPYDLRGFGSDEICVCCGFHYGYDDNGNNKNPYVIEQWRRSWINIGYKWFSSFTKPPSNWSPKEQLKGIT
ncbi:hypothetical protein HZF08_16855 [Paenibacillus sp. CGMCC 1.16610]|uniref:GATA-type domain-containing protein n=1 Tax=Paenibacillus anseongense TaxID=2682845 RepID=A0ABW9UJT6_9BACL|nr:MULTISPECIES: hypothetical protein [Paenibacillus]MBA2939983.1 hypothetical protein [Paenibacillus sp. CGMCC 1.16610]MVQ38938.1 hypothetical protein [Paenibacillus anseongense]